MVVLTLGTMLMTFPAARAAGASVLASAGIVAAIAAFAAQALLGNVFAGLQLAFGGALRLDDVVIAEDTWARVEEITLTYVVLRVWDDRRLIVPSSYFTTKPFENWTRTGAALLGTVEIDLDWSAPFDRMRAELDRVLTATPLWDGRVGLLQVTDAVGAFVRVRALVSAIDAPTLFDLRCHVRERLIGWLRQHHPDALPAAWRSVPAAAKPTRELPHPPRLAVLSRPARGRLWPVRQKRPAGAGLPAKARSQDEPLPQRWLTGAAAGGELAGSVGGTEVAVADGLAGGEGDAAGDDATGVVGAGAGPPYRRVLVCWTCPAARRMPVAVACAPYTSVSRTVNGPVPAFSAIQYP